MWGYDVVADALVVWIGPAVVMLVGLSVQMDSRIGGAGRRPLCDFCDTVPDGVCRIRLAPLLILSGWKKVARRVQHSAGPSYAARTGGIARGQHMMCCPRAFASIR
jgi:hypothetical protein